MSLGNSAESDLLKLLFQNTAWAGIGDAGGLLPSAGAGSLFAALHTADPGATGTQSTSEAAYGGYTRVGVARSAGGWTISGTQPTQAANTAATTFPQSSNGPETETFASVGKSTSGTGELIYKGALTANL